MTKAHIYRTGDKVRILRPNWIKRVGYPLIWTELIDEVKGDKRTLDALVTLGFNQYLTPFKSLKDTPINKQFLKAVAMMRVEERGFGGRERKIIYEDKEPTSAFSCSIMDYTHFGMDVISKRVAKTGTYYPPSGGYDSWSETDDYESGGLADCKTHVILKLDRGEICTTDVEPW